MLEEPGADGAGFLRLGDLTDLKGWCYNTNMNDFNEDHDYEDDDPNAERINLLVQKVHEAMEDIGLYSLDYSVGTNSAEVLQKAAEDSNDFDVRQLIESGEASFVLSGAFRVNELAWSDRVLDPEAHDLDRQFRRMMPSEAEMKLERLRQLAAEGKDIAALFDDEGEDS